MEPDLREIARRSSRTPVLTVDEADAARNLVYLAKHLQLFAAEVLTSTGGTAPWAAVAEALARARQACVDQIPPPLADAGDAGSR